MKGYAAVIAGLLLMNALSYCAPITLVGTLSGANENPATGSLGAGVATVMVDPIANTLAVSVVFSGLDAFIPGTSTASGTTASHIHCCVLPPGNAGVATTTPTFPGFPLGVDSGTYNQTFDLLSASSYNPAFITANGGTVLGAETALVNGLLGGRTYLNIHTNAFPGGEVRAFLATPEPPSALLTFTVMAGIWLAILKRR